MNLHKFGKWGLLVMLFCSMALLACGGGGGSDGGGSGTGPVTPVDAAPTISNVEVVVGQVSAEIKWLTNEGTTSVVDYGPTAAYEYAPVESLTLVTSHRIVLSGLTPGATYHYQILSEDSGGNTTTTADATFTTSTDPVPEPSDIQSDEFNDPSLDTGLWTFLDPRGDSSVSVSNGQLQIAVPAGSAHDAWEPNYAARLMQPVADKDFELVIKFDSLVTQRFQDQGIMIEESGENWLRFDLYHNGTNTMLYAASIVAGNTTVFKDQATPTIVVTPSYLKVQRNGDFWVFSYSLDDINWTEFTNFSHALTVTSVGPYAGNYSHPANDPVPAHTALIDYFRVP